MAGKGVRVLTTPTSDLGKILASFLLFSGLDVGGEINLTAAIQIAHLSLKHRQNKNQRQRIIVFPGSSIKYEKKALEVVGKRLKQNSVSLDIVNFGEDDDEKKPQKLEALLSAVNNNDGSHIVHVPSGANALSDVLLSTPVFTGDEGASGYVYAAAAAGGDFDFGVDPNIDPELALCLRVSMEKERARQEAAAKKAAYEAGDVNMSEADEDQDLALALQMSMSGEESSEAAGAGNLLGDQAFISSVLSSLLGVDPNDPAVQALLASLPDESKRNEEEESSSKSEDEKK
ncbi:hypothetical protein Bca52824_091718 [Brassica carinata]|uniref:26S proteasome non-ATPase regulatory subunit 4 homolog n=1 Tax=Brassica carinata TaxID=52824 RepID=A0A8X7NVQ8_BRACI|nr:hypothetical protein Bca52824_091718 [Brassica carinata]